MSIITVGWDKDYTTVSGAYDASSFGDTILIDEGVHNVSLDIKDKIVNLVGNTEHPDLTGVILVPEGDIVTEVGESVTAKSVIFDIEGNWGHQIYVSIRSIDFWHEGSKISNLNTTDFVAYATTSLTGSDSYPWQAFDTSLSKTGSWLDGNQWSSMSYNKTNQRLICVFNSPITFDEIRINNAHHWGNSTDMGAKNVVIYYSTDSITDTTYNASLANSELIFDGQFDRHVASNVEDEQILELTTGLNSLGVVCLDYSGPITDMYLENLSFYFGYSQVGIEFNTQLIKSKGNSPNLNLIINKCNFSNSNVVLYASVSAYIFDCAPNSLKSLMVKNCNISFYENGLCNSDLYEITDSSIIKTKLNRELYQQPFINNFFNTSDVSLQSFFGYGSKYGQNMVEIPMDCTFSGTVKLNGVYVNRELRAFRSDNGAFVNSTTSSGVDGFYTIGVRDYVSHDIICLDDIDPPAFNDLIRSDCTPYTEGEDGSGSGEIPDGSILVYATDKNDLALLEFGLTARLVNIGVFLVEGSFKDCSFLFGYEDTVPSSLLEPLSRFFSDPTDVRCYKNTIYVGYAYRGTSHASSSTAHSELTWPWPDNISLYVYYKNSYWGSSYYPSNTVYDVTNGAYIYDNFDDGSNSTFIGITSYAANTAKVQSDMNFGVTTLCGLSYGLNVYPYITGGEYGNTAVFNIPPLGPITAKSVIFDIADNWGGVYIGIRQIDFWSEGYKIDNPNTNYTAYVTSYYYNYVYYHPSLIFDTDTSKTGSAVWNQWISGNGVTTNQRLICVFNSSITFDQIRVNNSHTDGNHTDQGAKNVEIYISPNEETDTTYGLMIPDSSKIFVGQFPEHTPSNIEDEQIVLDFTSNFLL